MSGTDFQGESNLGLAVLREEEISLLSNATLLGLLFSPEEIQSLLEAFPPRRVAEGDVLLREGEASQYLVFATDSELQVVSSISDRNDLEHAELAAGRSFNLYSLLRGLPYQYSLRAKAECTVIYLPWRAVQEKLVHAPILNEYFLRLTESAEFQSLAKDLVEAGCSAEFRIQFIGSIETKKVSRQSWLLNQGQVPRDAILLTHGSLLAFQHAGEDQKILRSRWIVPQRVWLLWDDVVAQRPGTFTLRTQTDISFFAISIDLVRSLSQNFAADLELWSKWLASSSIAGSGRVQQEVETELDVGEVLEGTRYSRKPWLAFPWVQQNDQMDCGAACLAMVGQFFGKNLPIQFWRTQLSTDRDGTSAFDLCKTAERNGFISHALVAESLDDIPVGALPVIVLREYHYMVLYKINRKTVVLGDPRSGIRSVSHAEFLKGFEQIYILLRPTADFHKIESASKGGSHLWSLVANFKREIAIAFTASVLLVAASLLPPVLMQIMLDDVLSSNDLQLLKICLFAFAGFTVFTALMKWARAYFLQFVAIKLDFLAKTSFMQRLLSLPFSFFAVRHVGDFTRRLQEFETVRSFITEKSLSFVLSLVSLVIYLTVLFCYSVKIGLAVLCLAPPFIIVSMLFTRKLTANYSTYFSAKSEEDGFVSDMIRGMLAVKSNGAELAMRRRFEMHLVRSLKERYAFQMTSVAMQGLVSVLFELSKYGVVGFGVYLATRSELSGGQVMAISMLVNEVLVPFQNMALHWADFQEAKLVVNRLNDVFLTPSERSIDSQSGQRRNGLTGSIEFRDVWFRYGGESSDWILKGVSFSIPAGEKIAVVGPSGSGKSTIAMLINRMQVPQRGQILIDGKDHREFDLGWLRERIGLVTQESFLFPGTISENIALAGEFSSEETIRAAARTADASRFIEKKGLGYESFVPAGGVGFSGGEKQRLALARVLHRNPDVLILDEATAALDGVSEKNFLNQLDAWGGNKTVVSIAHRLSTVVMSRVVLVLEEGRVVASGNVDSLRESNLLFRRLFGFEEPGDELLVEAIKLSESSDLDEEVDDEADEADADGEDAA